LTTVIFGQQDDIHALAVAEHLPSYVILDDESIEHDVTITTDLDSKPVVFLDAKPIEATSVYWRNLDIYPFEDGDHLANSIAYMKLFLEAFSDARWVNPPPAFINHYTKVDQLRALDILKPKTLITNNLFDAWKFISMFESVAAKPVAGGDYVKRYWHPSELEELKQPVTLQEFIPGTNTRTFVIGEDVYTGEVTTTHDDFRLDKEFTYTPVELSPEERQLALDITSTLGYKWTAIDWIRFDGKLYFLEANFSPMFLYFQEQTGYPIAKQIANLLIQ